MFPKPIIEYYTNKKKENDAVREMQNIHHSNNSNENLDNHNEINQDKILIVEVKKNQVI